MSLVITATPLIEIGVDVAEALLARTVHENAGARLAAVSTTDAAVARTTARRAHPRLRTNHGMNVGG